MRVRFAEIIHAFDANKDGKVTREEMLSGVEKSFIGKTVDNLPGTDNAILDSISTWYIFLTLYNRLQIGGRPMSISSLGL